MFTYISIMRFFGVFLFISLGHFGLGAPSSQPGSLLSSRHEHGKLGAVASESTVCSRIGVRLIKDGGNAADAVRIISLCQRFINERLLIDRRLGS